LFISRFDEVKMNDLKSCIKQYRQIDDEIRDLNKQVYEKRDARKMVEQEIADIIRDPQFNSIKKIKLKKTDPRSHSSVRTSG